MASLDTAPPNVKRWFAARDSADPAAALRPVLADRAVFSFAGRRVEGAEAVLAHVLRMPGGSATGTEWSVLPGSDPKQVTVRGTGTGGAPLRSPGGPMSAIDFTFALDPDGRIAQITPQPHHSEPADLAAPLQPGQPAPDFTLPDTDGNPVPLFSGDASATAVVFTGNGCPWAMGWHSRLQSVGRDYAPRGVRLLQINANDPELSATDAVEVSRTRVAAGDFAGPYLLDDGQQVARQWGARHTPDVFVLTASGVVAYHGAPDSDVDDEAQAASWLRGALDSVLDGETAEPAQTQPTGCTIKWTLR